MKVGLIGFPMSGKSTLFRVAAGPSAKGSVASVPVPDPRFDRIVAQVKPKKITPATVVLHDDLEDAQTSSGKMFSQRFLDAARKMELLLLVIRAFDSETVPYHATVDPIRDLQCLEDEIVLTDLQIVENRLERLHKSPNAKGPGSQDYLDRIVLENFKAALEEGKPIRNLELDEDMESVVRNYQFLSAKPVVVAFNVGEDDVGQPPAIIAEAIRRYESAGTAAFAVSAEVEEEVSQLDPDDQSEFLKSLGLVEPASAKLIRAVYDAMGLITFFTAGENETKAWSLRRGSSALQAAAAIHSDIAKGFIRAEVVHYLDYDASGSLDKAYHDGKMNLVGKDHVIEDGDLIHIRNKS